MGETRKACARSPFYACLMGLVLTDISAIEAYRRDPVLGQRPPVALPFGKIRGLNLVRPRAAELREFDQRGYASFSRPVHVLVPHRDMRMAANDVRWHVWSGSLPKSGAGFRRDAKDVFLASPELALLHYASHADLADAIALAFELCGTYRLGGLLGFEKADPLTSAKRLNWFASGVQGARGAKRLRRIADRALDGSASPMETALAMLLSLPGTLGGLRPPFASPECTDRRVVKKRSQSIKTLLRCRPLLARSSFRRRVRQRSMACRTRADRPGCCSAKRAFVSGGQCGHGLQPADHERIEDGRCGAHRGESPRAIGAPEGEGVAQTQ